MGTLSELWVFTHVTLIAKRHSAQNNLFSATKPLNEDIQQPENSTVHREKNITWSKHKLDTRKTNKNKSARGKQIFQGKKACHGGNGHTEKWRSRLYNFGSHQTHTFAIQLQQQNHNFSVYHCCFLLFFITDLRSLNERQLQDL